MSKTNKIIILVCIIAMITTAVVVAASLTPNYTYGERGVQAVKYNDSKKEYCIDIKNNNTVSKHYVPYSCIEIADYDSDYTYITGEFSEDGKLNERKSYKLYCCMEETEAL